MDFGFLKKYWPPLCAVGLWLGVIIVGWDDLFEMGFKSGLLVAVSFLVFLLVLAEMARFFYAFSTRNNKDANAYYDKITVENRDRE